MSAPADVLGSTAAAVLVLMVAAWLVSLVRSDAGVAHVVWGLGFVVIGWVGWWVGDGLSDRRLLLAAMVTIWGLRLTVHVFVRNRHRPEDFRYRARRDREGDRFAMSSLMTVFVLHGVLIFFVSVPIQLARSRPSRPSAPSRSSAC